MHETAFTIVLLCSRRTPLRGRYRHYRSAHEKGIQGESSHGAGRCVGCPQKQIATVGKREGTTRSAGRTRNWITSCASCAFCGFCPSQSVYCFGAPGAAPGSPADEPTN